MKEKFLILFIALVTGSWFLIPGSCFAAGEMYYNVQSAWDNPDANMAIGSTRPGYAQLTWTPGTTLPIRLRNGMVTQINLPTGEQIEDGIIGADAMFKMDAQKGGRTIDVTPLPTTMGGDTNMIVTGKSGNKYIFYLRVEPGDASEITYSMVDVVLEGGAKIAGIATTSATTAGTMNSIFKTAGTGTSVAGDGEDYGWIKSMKINPSEFRFDLDIFVPNPDDFVIAPERVWRDQIFTYIDFGDKVIAMTQRPVVSILIEGGESPVGFRTDGEHGRLIIVEAVGDMVLRSGQRVVCIKRREKPFLIADTASVMALAESNVMNSMYSSGSLNNVAYMGAAPAMGGAAYDYGAYGIPMAPVAMPTATGGGTSGVGYGSQIPADRNTAGAYLPSSNIPMISGGNTGVSVELASDPSVKALNDYWTSLLAKFSGDDGAGILTPWRDKVFFAVDEQGVGDLGSTGSAARLYRLRIGPMADIDTAQNFCAKLQRSNNTSCHVVRIQ
ncbi:MAG: TrbG/VirB9 family P-type conjugative transfer protein [Rickettsiales bacterium]|jgi:ComB9 competence protein|nr:TrbG/VirB9 family P-type conjugative transfer protein [Rickettsiales bacterium]